MQQIRYAATSWNDIKHSPGWFGKVALLALINFIPVFGQIVTYGYAYGWARDIAWGVHAPLPARIFGNEDGKLYSRGFFILVVGFVFALIPALASSIASAVMGGSVAYSAYSGSHAPGPIAGFFGMLFGLVAFAGVIAVVLVLPIASMRTAIYDRISAGFQLKKIWAMLRYDTNGILKIFGMTLLLGLIGSVVFSFVMGILTTIIFGASAPTLMGLSSQGTISSYDVMRVMGPSIGVWLLVMTVLGYFAMVYGAFMSLMMTRAAGYWTQQFNVAQWGGQDDPMPFEVGQTQQQAWQAQYAAQVQYAQAQAEYAQAQGQQVNYQHQQAAQAYAQAQAAVQAQAQADAQTQAQAQEQPPVRTEATIQMGDGATPSEFASTDQAPSDPLEHAGAPADAASSADADSANPTA